MRKVGMLFALAIACSSCGRPPPRNAALQFGPPTAEGEIRQLFAIRGPRANINDLHRIARQKHIDYEELAVDHSVLRCQIDNPNDLIFEQFLAGMAPSGDHSLDYVVIHDRQGNVVCIETRHAFRGL